MVPCAYDALVCMHVFFNLSGSFQFLKTQEQKVLLWASKGTSLKVLLGSLGGKCYCSSFFVTVWTKLYMCASVSACVCLFNITCLIPVGLKSLLNYTVHQTVTGQTCQFKDQFWHYSPGLSYILKREVRSFWRRLYRVSKIRHEGDVWVAQNTCGTLAGCLCQISGFID